MGRKPEQAKGNETSTEQVQLTHEREKAAKTWFWSCSLVAEKKRANQITRTHLNDGSPCNCTDALRADIEGTFEKADVAGNHETTGDGRVDVTAADVSESLPRENSIYECFVVDWAVESWLVGIVAAWFQLKTSCRSWKGSCAAKNTVHFEGLFIRMPEVRDNLLTPNLTSKYCFTLKVDSDTKQPIRTHKKPILTRKCSKQCMQP